MPTVDQVEITPRWNRHDLKAELADLHLVFEGWAPLGQGDKELLTWPALTGPAERTGKSPALADPGGQRHLPQDSQPGAHGGKHRHLRL